MVTERVRISVEHYSGVTGLGVCYASVNNAEMPDDVATGLCDALRAVLGGGEDGAAVGCWSVLWAAKYVLQDEEFLAGCGLDPAEVARVAQALDTFLTVDGCYRHVVED